MRRTLLLDADIFAYEFSAANEKVIYFDGADSAPAISSNFAGAKRGVAERIEQIAQKLKADEVIICLSDPTSNYFRKEVWPAYKAQRAEIRKPTHLRDLKEWFKSPESGFKTYERPGLEADDCMGILATHPTLIRGDKIIVSEDKDMQTIPGLLFNPRKDGKAPRNISKLQADRFHMWQTIVGDQTDGYPGARGVGPKSPEATAVLTARTPSEAWSHVLAAFKRAKPKPGDPEYQDQALIMARLARILRASDWSFDTKKPRLWTP
jgi:DNA polymerase-1